MRDRQNQTIQMIAAVVGATAAGVLIGACFAVVDGKAWGRNVLMAIAVPVGGLVTYHVTGKHLKSGSRISHQKWQNAVDATTEQLIDASQKQLSAFSSAAFLPPSIGTEVPTEVVQQSQSYSYEPTEVTEATAPQEFSIGIDPWDDPMGSHFSAEALQQ